MKIILKNFIFISTIVVASSCNFDDEKEKDLVNTVNHDGSIETSVSVNHLDSLHDILITKHIVWNNETTSKVIEQKDTIPALGFINTNAENADGEKKSVTVKKDYEIFITVK